MIQLVVFDMAGTTVDERNVVYRTVREAVNAAGYAFTAEQVQAVGAGKEKSQAIRDVLALDGDAHGDSEVAAIFSDFKERLQRAYETLEVRGMPGAETVFAELRRLGIRVALNTGYDRPTAERLLAKIGWRVGVDVDALVTASDVAEGRPAPAMIQRAMELCAVSSPDAVAKVGDSQVDIEEGKNAACGKTFGITTGAQTAEQLREARPTAIVDSLDEILSHLAAD